MVVLFIIGAPSLAQDSAAPGSAADPRADICYGVAFGAWQPALDWTAAGHRPPQPPRYVAPPARGRSEPPARSPSAGEAMALVADARLTPPRASVRVARIPCRRR